ncbi:MAG: 4Fe-4S dicluster domain-containing protein [Candidatus Verstraetearchaeota archaeon]|nr:4Fe-4S dicluster domain-containing protein [Candidatus Verstraetearchaeota archaeon]
MERRELTEKICGTAISAGASICGIADLRLLRGIPTCELDLDKFKYAVAYGVALPTSAVESITVEGPGRLYAWAYKTANSLLDLIGIRISCFVSEVGGESLVIPSSMRVDIGNELGHVSHKAFALAAGLGWIGRNNLLVTPEFGPRVRLGTVLTDLELEPGSPMMNRCGDCRLCVTSCPSHALSFAEFEVRPSSREAILDLKRCSSRLKTMKELLSKKAGAGDYAAEICGVCIKVCPYGKKTC